MSLYVQLGAHFAAPNVLLLAGAAAGAAAGAQATRTNAATITIVNKIVFARNIIFSPYREIFIIFFLFLSFQYNL
jgi:hypothetical protein